MRFTVAIAVAALLAASGCDHSVPTAGERPVVRANIRPGENVPQAGYVVGADGVWLRYEIRGQGPEVAVVLHGGPGLSMSYLADDLAALEPGRALIYYDQRGGGFSGLPDASLLTADRMVADLETLRQQFGLERLTLIGNSWGGGLAALYATRYPDRVERLVLLGPGPSSTAVFGEELPGIFALFPPEDLAQLVFLNDRLATATDSETAQACERVYGFLFARYQQDPASLRSMRGRWCGGTPAAVRLGSMVTQQAVIASLGQPFDVPAALARALAGRRVPTLVIEGKGSPFTRSAAAFAAAIPGAEFVILDNAGHFPWLENPRAFFGAVDAFLRRTAPATE